MENKPVSHQHQDIIRELAWQLRNRLKGAVMKDAFSASRHEAVMVFALPGGFFSIRLMVEPATFLLFFDNHEATRGPSVYPLFEKLKGRNVQGVRIHSNNRSFEILFDAASILFKLYGPQANLIMLAHNAPAELFRTSFEKDRHLSSGDFIEDHSYNGDPGQSYFIIETTDGPVFSTDAADGEVLLHTADIFEAYHFFSKVYLKAQRASAQMRSLLREKRDALKRQQTMLAAAQEGLKEMLNSPKPAEIANIIMANLHTLVKLDKTLTPQANAEAYYKKARREKNRVDELQKKIEASQAAVLRLQNEITQIEQNPLPLVQEKTFSKKTREESSPHRAFSYHGFSIWVGKTAAGNDQLTLKHAHKEDLWLHAKGVSGSHVVIRHQHGKPFTKQVILFAAQLAAYYSKARGSILVPVIYTKRKFVRKPRGAEPGAVQVEREEMVMAQPVKPSEAAGV
jgi:predicted ribosome quality control (RQC) complex YloA/Tae2 family protein